MLISALGQDNTKLSTALMTQMNLQNLNQNFQITQLTTKKFIQLILKVKLLLNSRFYKFLDQNDETCLIFDDQSFSSEPTQSSININYNYPKKLYIKIFPSTTKGQSKPANFSKITQKLNLPEGYFNEMNSVITLSIDKSNAPENKSKAASIELQKSTQPDTVKIDLKKSNRRNTDEQMALEDWLDQVL